MGRVTTLVIGLAMLVGIHGKHPVSLRSYEPRSADMPLEHIAVISDSYTTGSAEGGEGPKAWTVRAWQLLSGQGVQVVADVAAEGWAGYGARGNHGNAFQGLTEQAVHPDDELVVFFGSRNDQGIEPMVLAGMARDTFEFARRTAPAAQLLVIGPAWPTFDVPYPVVQVRDTLKTEADAVGAVFVDPIAEGWFVGRPDLIGADGVHPNDAGHAYLADKIVPLIRTELLAIRT